MPYSGDPAASPHDQLRFMVGDTSASPVLTDAEVAYLVETHGSATAAGPFACEAMLAKFAQQVDYTAGRTSKALSQRIAHYEKLAATLRAQAARYVAPISTGQYRAVDEADRANTALKQPQFTLGLHDNPGADSDAISPRPEGT